MRKERCWVWFKVPLGGGTDVGLGASTTEQPGLLIEHPGYVSCRVPEWRGVQGPDLN